MMNEKLEKYISIINSHLDQKKGEENLDELIELFALAEFIEAMKSQRMDIYFESDRKNKKDNKKVVDYLLGALGVLLRNEEAGNENIEFLYFYLKERRTQKENKNLLLLMIGVMLGMVVGYLILQWQRIDFILMLMAPSKNTICKEIENEFDVQLSVGDIRVRYPLNDDYKTEEKYPKMVLYTIPVIVGDEKITFSGKWVPFQEVTFDLELVLAEECLKDYGFVVPECKADGDTFYCDLLVDLLDQESKEVLLQQLKIALQDTFSNSYIAEKFDEYVFQIVLDDDYYDKNIYFTVREDNLEEKIEQFSNELDMILVAIENL